MCSVFGVTHSLLPYFPGNSHLFCTFPDFTGFSEAPFFGYIKTNPFVGECTYLLENVPPKNSGVAHEHDACSLAFSKHTGCFLNSVKFCLWLKWESGHPAIAHFTVDESSSILNSFYLATQKDGRIFLYVVTTTKHHTNLTRTRVSIFQMCKESLANEIKLG